MSIYLRHLLKVTKNRSTQSYVICLLGSTWALALPTGPYSVQCAHSISCLSRPFSPQCSTHGSGDPSATRISHKAPPPRLGQRKKLLALVPFRTSLGGPPAFSKGAVRLAIGKCRKTLERCRRVGEGASKLKMKMDEVADRLVMDHMLCKLVFYSCPKIAQALGYGS